MLLASLLLEQGHDVSDFGTAESALEAFDAGAFDLMLVDWVLPGMSGLDLCRAIRQRDDGRDVVIVVVTGHGSADDIREIIEAGASDFVQKPIEPEMLRLRLSLAGRLAETARRRRVGAERLVRAEEAFEALIASSPDAVYVVSEDLIVYSNRRFLSYLGYDSQDDLLGHQQRDVVHSDDLPQLRSEQRRYLSRGEPTVPTEIRFRRRDSTIVTGETVAVPLDFGGRPATLRMVRDVSDRKAMQAQLLLADRMASVGTLAAGVAHELNNPLAYVVTNLVLTREVLEQPPTAQRLAEARQQLEEAVDGAHRLQAIVGDLKTFSRDDDRPTSVDPTRVVESAVAIAWNELRHRAQLHRELGPIPKVRINEGRLSQVVLNLLINAAHAMDEGTVSQNEIHVSTRTDAAGWAVIEVRDNGCGIASDMLTRIFDPFFTTKPMQRGTGLGLSICRNIVTTAGGAIDVESQIDEGSRFRVRLPPFEGEELPVTDAPPPITNQRSAKILVIDDEELVGRAVRRALRRHDVTVTTSGSEALSLMGQEPKFDLVFCDLMMPEMSGMEVFAAAREQHPEIAERFVFMTGGAFTERARGFLEGTTQEWIDKPFSVTELRRFVARFVGRVTSTEEPRP